MTEANNTNLSKREAIRIISALRNGTSCLEGAAAYSAGRDILVEAAKEELEELVETESASVKWLKGQYGQGKTHMFSRLMDLGHSRNWVTSFCQVTTPGQGLEVSRINEIYSEIAKRCLCREMISEQGGEVDPGRRSGLSWILDAWCKALRSQAGAATGDVPTFTVQRVIDSTIARIGERWGIVGDYAEALRQYARAHLEHDQEWLEILMLWFIGNDVHSRGGVVRKRLREAGIRDSLNRRNAKEMLRNLSAFIRCRGYGGLMILLDEVENVIQYTPKKRREAYTVLRELIDNVDGRHGMTSTCFFAAGTPELFDGQKGFVEYEALAERVILPAGAAVRNPRAAIIDLSHFSLQQKDFLLMARRVAGLYGIAYGRVIPDTVGTQIDDLFGSISAKSADLKVREWVRQVTSLFDMEKSAWEALPTAHNE